MQERIRWIDSLRGIACLLVVSAHLLATHPIYGPYASGCGKIGVWLFFSLSGYLLLNGVDDISITAKWCGKYYLKKMVKLYPIYVIGLLFAFCVGQIQSVSEVLQHIVLLKGSGHFWYMAVILKFYLIAPGIIWLYKKWNRILFVTVLMVVAIVDLFLFPPYEYVENSISMRWYIVVFIYGMLLHIIQDRLKKKEARLYWDIGVIILGCCIICMTAWFREQIWGIPPSSFLQNKYWVIGLIWCVILFCIDRSKLLIKYLEKSYVFSFLGKISYPVYIIHHIILHWLWPMGLDWKLMAIIYICSSVLVGWMLSMVNEKMTRVIKKSD